jgi:hypothetical protein
MVPAGSIKSENASRDLLKLLKPVLISHTCSFRFRPEQLHRAGTASKKQPEPLQKRRGCTLLNSYAACLALSQTDLEEITM